VTLGLYYFTYLGAIGVFLPFVSLYLASTGLPAAEVTRVMALGPLAGLLVPPAIGLVADARRAREWLLRLLTLATVIASLGFVRERPGRLALYLTMAAFSSARAPLLSLVDAAALDRAHQGGASYGSQRLWGSLGFLLAVLGGGALFDGVGADRVMLGATVGLVAAFAVAFTLPALPTEPRPHILVEWRRMLAAPSLWLFLGAVVLGQAAGATYDGAFSLHLKRLGFSGRFVGAAWAVGVAAEIGVLAASHRALVRFTPERLVAAGFLTAAVRWLLLGRARAGWQILLLQPLHGITFGLTYVAAVHLVRARGHAAPTAAQGLYATAMMIGSFIGMMTAGALLDRIGGAGLFTVAAGLAGIATALAGAYARAQRPTPPLRLAA
jgi:PPP family 3-phenylpropionic acid transporter